MKKMIQDRRDFLKKSTYSTLLGLIIPNVPFAQKTPQILTPAEGVLPHWKNKELIILSDKPWNVETPPHLLDDKVTPVEKMFIRNNGLIPEGNIDINTWTLTIGGESVKTAKTYKLKELKEKFKHYTYQLTLECGGNGRSGYFPQTSGNQWEQGAVSCAEWTGVRLKDILAEVGLKDDAVYIGYYGQDIHLSRTPNKSVISRGVPIKKALEDETLIAWAVNGKDIPLEHGFPLRLVIGGWPASVSGKWLDKIVVRNKEHDGEKMTGHSYRVPIHPIEPGEKLAETPENFKIIGAMPVKSLITYPKTGAVIDAGKTLTLRGHAWAGDLTINEVSLSLDYGVTWKKCNLEAPKNRLAWQHWSLALDFSQKGYFEVWVKATDSEGITQPMVIPQWNPGGYLNNACHRIAVKVV
ncbi:DMSO/TMAO reductase YedYZ molybdopterin-dependent catalytic subunit [Arcicella rosea]|uniref:sulfite oxidase n=1 Tax=Arcicella rosea TaxID=502909 RepID=UPI00345DC175